MTTKTTKKLYVIVLIIACIGLLIGSFYDYQIAQAIYKKDANFSLFFSSFHYCFDGVWLSLLAGGIIGYGVRKKDEKRLWNLISIVLGSLVIIIFSLIQQSSMFSVNGIFKYYNPNLELPFIVKFLCGFIYQGGFGLIGYFFVYKCINRKNIYLFILILVSFGVPYGIVTIIKDFVNRPRFRFILAHEECAFYNWFEHFDNLQYYLDLGFKQEEFRSFPSGHSQVASMLMLFLVNLPNYFKKLKGKETILFFIGLAYLVLIQFTRMNCGAHFLSDVSFAVIITIVCDIVIFKIFYHKIYPEIE